MRKGGLFISNWVYLVWLVIFLFLSVLFLYALNNDIKTSIFISLGFYSVTILLALSPIGEGIVRLQLGAKAIITMQDAEYLMPIFEEVYEEAKKAKPLLSSSIKLYMIDDPSINACAVGRNTIALTSGSARSLSPEQLRGILAHEFGHLANGDTKALLLTRVGNGFFIVILKLIEIAAKILNFVFNLFKNTKVISLFIRIIYFCLMIVIKIFYGLSDIILSINSRSCEYLADNFAYRIGFGRELIETLYSINMAFPDGQKGLLNNITKSHPYTTKRIARLEQIVNAGLLPA